MLGLVVCGSRTWTWTMAAPALAASIADCAICAGVTGTAGFLPGVSAEPVTAQAIITLRFMFPPAGAYRASLAHVPAKLTLAGREGHAPMHRSAVRADGGPAAAVSTGEMRCLGARRGRRKLRTDLI